MKALNEKEINSNFFKTLGLYIAAAVVLLIATFLGIQIRDVEYNGYKTYYEKHKANAAANISNINEFHKIDNNLIDLSKTDEVNRMQELESEITREIKRLRLEADSADNTRTMLLGSFNRRMNFTIEIKSLKNTIKKLNSDIQEVEKDLNKCQRRMAEYQNF